MKRASRWGSAAPFRVVPRWPEAPSPPPATGSFRWWPGVDTGPPRVLVQRYVQDLVAAVVRRAVLVTAGRGDPDVAVRARLDGAHPAELAGEVRLRRRGAAALDLHDPQPGTAQGGHVEGVVHDRQATGGRLGD